MPTDFTRTAQKLLEIQHISLSLGARQVLRDVNACITDITRPDQVEGQVVCFLGPSGMGKTQLARIIAGLPLPRHAVLTGQVILDTDVPTRKGLVGMVPQNYPLFEFMTVQRNLILAGRQGGLTLDQSIDKMHEFVDLFGLGDYLTLYPKEISGGTRQRVAIARQMMCAEHFLVMDEPFSGLDPIMKAKASEAVTKLATRDSLNTTIVITHDISEGLAVADLVWLLGLEPDGHGGFLPGARLVEQYDLAAMGLAWHPDIQSDKTFLDLVGTIKHRFQTLR